MPLSHKGKRLLLENMRDVCLCAKIAVNLSPVCAVYVAVSWKPGRPSSRSIVLTPHPNGKKTPVRRSEREFLIYEAVSDFFCICFIRNRKPNSRTTPTGRQINGLWTKPAKIYTKKEITATVIA